MPLAPLMNGVLLHLEPPGYFLLADNVHDLYRITVQPGDGAIVPYWLTTVMQEARDHVGVSILDEHRGDDPGYSSFRRAEGWASASGLPPGGRFAER